MSPFQILTYLLAVDVTILVSDQGCLTGTFSNVSITAPSSGVCGDIYATQLQTPKSLALIFDLDTSKCTTPIAPTVGETSSNAIVIPTWGYAVIAVGGVLIIVGIFVILVFNVNCLTRRFMPMRLVSKGTRISSL